MKILHVTPYFHKAWAYGGIPRLSFHLTAAQAALGHEVHVVTTDALDESQRRPPGDYEVAGVKVRVYRNVSNLAAYHFQFFCPLGLSREQEFLPAYDVIHIHGHRNFLNSRLAAFAFRAGRPTVLMPNGTLVNIERRRLFKFIYDVVWGREQVRKTTAFVAVSETEREQFLSLGIPAERVRVIPNGVKIETATAGNFRAAYGIRSEYLLYLGKITPRKGIEHVISALPLLSDPTVGLVVAGNDMGFRRTLEGHARRLGVSSRLLFTGLLTGPLKSAAYAEALFTVYVGRDEIFGLVPWESILHGTPVIVADDSGCGEWIRKAGAGHVVPYGCPGAIAAVVNQRDRARDEVMVEAGRRFCRQWLNWNRIAGEMIEYYEDVLRQRSRTGEGAK